MGITNEGKRKFRGPVLLDYYDLAIVKALDNDKSLIIGDLQRKLSIRRKNMLIHVERLYKLGFISFQMEKRRQRVINITPKGSNLVNLF